MALLGGGVGGAGNPVGGSFTGPATALEIIGNLAYCYTGNHAASTTSVEAMKFTTGNYNFMGIFQVNAAVSNADDTGTAHTFAQIELNGSIISHVIAGRDQSDALTSNQQPLIIPAYTEVVVKLYCDEIQADRYMTATITGEIVRGL